MRMGEMTVREAGKRGGDRTKKLHGKAHYERMGAKGGSTTLRKHGVEHFRRAARKSAEARAKETGRG